MKTADGIICSHESATRPPHVVFVGNLPAFLGISVHGIRYLIGVDVFASLLAG